MIEIIFSLWMWLAAGLVCVFLYAVLLRRLAEFVQPLRLRIARAGEQILQSGSLAASQAKTTNWMLDNIFSGWVAFTTALAFPILGPIGLIKAINEGPRSGPNQNGLGELSILFFVSIWAANPIFGTILVVEFIVLLLPIAVITASPYLLLRVVLFAIGAEARTGRLHAAVPH